MNFPRLPALQLPSLRRLGRIAAWTVGSVLMLVLAGYAYMLWDLRSKTTVLAGWTISPSRQDPGYSQIESHGLAFTIYDTEQVLFHEDDTLVSINNEGRGLRYDLYRPRDLDWTPDSKEEFLRAPGERIQVTPVGESEEPLFPEVTEREEYVILTFGEENVHLAGFGVRNTREDYIFKGDVLFLIITIGEGDLFASFPPPFIDRLRLE